MGLVVGLQLLLQGHALALFGLRQITENNHWSELFFPLKLNLEFIKNIKRSQKNTYSSHTEQPFIHCPQILKIII